MLHALQGRGCRVSILGEGDVVLLGESDFGVCGLSCHSNTKLLLFKYGIMCHVLLLCKAHISQEVTLL